MENGVSGLLSPMDDLCGFERNIAALLGDVHRMRRMGKRPGNVSSLSLGEKRTTRSLRDVYVNTLEVRYSTKGMIEPFLREARLRRVV